SWMAARCEVNAAALFIGVGKEGQTARQDPLATWPSVWRPTLRRPSPPKLTAAMVALGEAVVPHRSPPEIDKHAHPPVRHHCFAIVAGDAAGSKRLHFL